MYNIHIEHISDQAGRISFKSATKNVQSLLLLNGEKEYIV